MKQRNKTIIIIIFTIIVTFTITSYLINTQTIKVMSKAVVEMQTFNEVGRVESWDNVENLLIKKCNKEALELIKIQKTLSLSEIKSNIENNDKLIKIINKRNPDVLRRAQASSNLHGYTIPTCK